MGSDSITSRPAAFLWTSAEPPARWRRRSIPKSIAIASTDKIIMPMPAILIFPAALAPVVSGFRALNDFHPQPLLRQPGIAHLDRTTGKWSRANARRAAHLTSGANALYIAGPQDFATIYGVNQVWKARTVGRVPAQTIAVVGDDQPGERRHPDFSRCSSASPRSGPTARCRWRIPHRRVCAAPDPSDN